MQAIHKSIEVAFPGVEQPGSLKYWGQRSVYFADNFSTRLYRKYSARTIIFGSSVDKSAQSKVCDLLKLPQTVQSHANSSYSKG